MVGEETSGATNGPVFFVGDARVTVSIDYSPTIIVVGVTLCGPV